MTQKEKVSTKDQGWLPKTDNPKKMREILSSHPLLNHYPYLLKKVLLLAIEKDFDKVANVLLDYKDTPKNYDDYARLAISKDKPQIVLKLIQNGFKINPNLLYPSALCLAIKHKSQLCLEILLKENSLPNWTTHIELTQALLEISKNKSNVGENKNLKEVETKIARTILERYPYKQFLDLKEKKACPLKESLKHLSNLSNLKSKDSKKGLDSLESIIFFLKKPTIAKNMEKELEKVLKAVEPTIIKTFLKNKVNRNSTNEIIDL
jgi:hypothetical protein